MKHTEEQKTVGELVDLFSRNALIVNPEYQRGAVWTERQQGKFIDSILRHYPVPAVFLRLIQQKGLRGAHETVELIDGQQRLRALADFMSGAFKLPPVTGPSRLRLPAKVAEAPAPWAERNWNELSAELRRQVQETRLRVFIVEDPTTDDEVRDLFIRLQAGTALSRQQIRDAWPGPISPFVESIGGKGRRRSHSGLLSMVDKRGNKDAEEDARDPWVSHRQTCAQLLSVFLARERDPYARPRISAEDLDELYHENMAFDPTGEPAMRFRDSLSATEEVFSYMAREHEGRKTKWKKVHIFSVFMVAQDIHRSPEVPASSSNLERLATITKETEERMRHDRIRFSNSALLRWGDALRGSFFAAAGRLDSSRDFSDKQKKQVWQRAAGKCEICGRAVQEGDAEYDHYPIPWAMCGPTTVENCRLVHKACHPRGRPRTTDR